MPPPNDTQSVPELFAESLRAQQAEDYDRAQVLLRRVLALDPGHADALNNLGLIAYLAHCYPEAIDLIGKALARAPSRAAFHSNLGVVLSVSGRRREAVDSFGRAVTGAPANTSFRCNLANALKECGEFPRALAEFRAASALDARYGEAHFGAALCLLALGRIEEAWPEHRWRVVSGAVQVPASGGALYQDLGRTLGEAMPARLRGRRLLVLNEQGLGDQLFFLRFAPVLKTLGAKVVFFAPEKLAALLARCGVLEHVFTNPDDAPRADHTLLAGDLPLAAAPSSATTPPPLAIKPDPAALAAMKGRLAAAGPPPYLGITWRAGTAPATGRPGALRKSVPLDALARAVAAWPGTAIVLQHKPQEGEIAVLASASGLRVHDCSDLNEDLVAMHALLSLVDDYVGVSNTNVHLRAAAGRTARVLVAFPAEWRWLGAGDASPWFPGFSLYREEEGTGWGAALARLAGELLPPVKSPRKARGKPQGKRGKAQR